MPAVVVHDHATFLGPGSQTVHIYRRTGLLTGRAACSSRIRPEVIQMIRPSSSGWAGAVRLCGRCRRMISTELRPLALTTRQEIEQEGGLNGWTITASHKKEIALTRGPAVLWVNFTSRGGVSDGQLNMTRITGSAKRQQILAVLRRPAAAPGASHPIIIAYGPSFVIGQMIHMLDLTPGPSHARCSETITPGRTGPSSLRPAGVSWDSAVFTMCPDCEKVHLGVATHRIL